MLHEVEPSAPAESPLFGAAAAPDGSTRIVGDGGPTDDPRLDAHADVVQDE
jgi:hypothetical protein